jgi:hypothetical protein
MLNALQMPGGTFFQEQNAVCACSAPSFAVTIPLDAEAPQRIAADGHQSDILDN